MAEDMENIAELLRKEKVSFLVCRIEAAGPSSFQQILFCN